VNIMRPLLPHHERESPSPCRVFNRAAVMQAFPEWLILDAT